LPSEALELGLIDGIKTSVEAVNELEPTMDKAMTPEDVSRMVAEGIAAGLAAERSRAAAIRGCEEARGREQLASHLAEATSLSVDEARAILSAAGEPVANTRQAANGFAAAMDHSPNPNVCLRPGSLTRAGSTHLTCTAASRISSPIRVRLPLGKPFYSSKS
jgi:hypothetical protein